MTVPVYIFPAVSEGSLFYTTSPTLVITCLVDNSHSNRYEVVWAPKQNKSPVFKLWKAIFRKQGRRYREQRQVPSPGSSKVAPEEFLVNKCVSLPLTTFRFLNMSQGFQHQNGSQLNPDQIGRLCTLISSHSWKILLQILQRVMGEGRRRNDKN